MNTKQFKPCKKADQIGANDSTCCVRQRKTNCGHVYYRGATTANSDHAAVVWELSWSAAHLKCCRSVCNSTEYELQPVWVRVVQSQLSKFNTGYALRGTHGGTAEQQQPQDIPRCGWLAPGLASTTSLHCLPEPCTSVRASSYSTSIMVLGGWKEVNFERKWSNGFRKSMMIPILPFHLCFHSEQKKGETNLSFCLSSFPESTNR